MSLFDITQKLAFIRGRIPCRIRVNDSTWVIFELLLQISAFTMRYSCLFDLLTHTRIWIKTPIRQNLFSNDLKVGQVWHLNGPNVLGCQMIWFLNGGLKTGQKISVLWSKMSGFVTVRLITWSDHLKTKQISVRCSVFRWLLLIQVHRSKYNTVMDQRIFSLLMSMNN